MLLGILILSLYAIMLLCIVFGSKEVQPDNETFKAMNNKENLIFAAFAIALLICAALILLRLCVIF